MTIKDIEEKVKHIQEAVRTFKKLGISRNVIEVYIKGRTGYPIKDIRAIIDAQEEFFDNLLLEKLSGEEVKK